MEPNSGYIFINHHQTTKQSSSALYLLLLLCYYRVHVLFFLFPLWKHKYIIHSICSQRHRFSSSEFKFKYTYWSIPGGSQIAAPWYTLNQPPTRCQRSPQWYSQWGWHSLGRHLGVKITVRQEKSKIRKNCEIKYTHTHFRLYTINYMICQCWKYDRKTQHSYMYK